MEDVTRLNVQPSLSESDAESQLELLTTLIEDLSLQVDLEQMAEKALLAATRMTGVDAGSVALFTEDREHLCYRWHIWQGDESSISDMQRPFRINHGIAGKALRSGKTEIVEDYPNFSEALQSFVEAGVSSVLATPIFDQAGQALGIFSLAIFHQQYEFNSTSVRLAEAVARQFGVAIQRHNLLEDLQKSSRALRTLSACNEVMMHARSEDDLLQRVCEVIIDTEDYLGAWVAFKGDDAYKSLTPHAVAGVDMDALLEIEYSWGESNEGNMPPGQAVRSGKPVRVNNVFLESECECCRELARKVGYQSVLALPLIIDEDTVGVVVIYARDINAFSDEEITLLADMGRDLSFGLQTLRIRKARREEAIKLRESEQQFKTIFENAHDGILVIDSKTRKCKAANRSIAEILGYTEQELVGIGVEDIHPPEVLEQVRAAFQRAVDGEEKIFEDFPVLRKDGDIRYVNITAAPVEVGGRHYVVSSFRDITERKQARQALQKSEIRYGELFNKMLDGVAIHEMVYDERGEAVDYRFLKVNPAFEKNTGLQAEAIIGKTICEVMPETEDVWINTYANVVSSGEAARFEKHSKVLDKYYEVVAFASGDKRFATIFQDITDRRESERLLMRTNRALRTLSRCNEILVHTSNEQRLLDDICHAIVELGKFQLVWVGLAEEDKDKSIRIATRCGQATAFLDDVAISWAGPDADPGPTGNAIRSGEAQVERYISRADDPVPWRRVAVEHGLASFIALPMHIGDTVLGAVNIYSGREDAFDSEEANLLMDLAQDLAYGIASQRARVAHAGAIQAVKRNEHNLHSIINHEADGIMVLDADDTILFTNPALEKVLGRESKKFIGTQFGFPIADDDSSEIELINQNGELIQCEMRVTDVEWLNKPARLVSIHDISERIRLEQEREENLKRQQEMLVETITAMSNAVETRDPYTAGHMHRVSDLSIVIAEQMGLDSDQIEGIRLGGIIHDIGKLSVPAEILNRPGRLTPAEFEIIKSHSQVGYDIIKGVSFRWPVAEMVYQHHERIDGSGYPNGLKGNEIVLEARILAVADVVEAMSSHRPYRASLGLEPALEEIRKNAGKIYDQEVVDACLQVIETGQFTIE